MMHSYTCKKFGVIPENVSQESCFLAAGRMLGVRATTLGLLIQLSRVKI